MKQKIKVMKEKPTLSDDEIRGYMDFDRLVSNVKIQSNPVKFSGLWKRLIPALAISGLLVWFIFYTEQDQEPDTAYPPVHELAPTQTQSEMKPEEEANEENKGNVAPKENPTSAVTTPDKTVTKNPVSSEAGQANDIYVQAEPANGYPQLYEYFNHHLTYPPEAIKDSVEGVQTVSFQINVEGKPEKIQVKQSLGVPFEKEAARIIENMPAWKPATLNGKPVPSQVSLPLTFQLRQVKTNE